MQINVMTIVLGFLEGLALIASPCIFPILPVLLVGSMHKEKTRTFGVILGFVLIFSLVTFFSRTLVQLLGVDFNVVREVAYVLLVILGVIMLSSLLTAKFAQLTQRLSAVSQTFFTVHNRTQGFFNGFFLGGIIALVWTPCAGPILAVVIVQTVLQQATIMSFFILIAFAIGAAIPMLLISLFGQDIVMKLSVVKQHGRLFRRILGGIIILSVVYMVYADRIANAAASVGVKSASQLSGLRLEQGLLMPYAAPPIAGIDAWINSKPLQLSALKGHVVLIDFWTYSCINCIRTLPYLKSWYQKYHDKGLVIIGVHSPEFNFEKNVENVKQAVKQDGITYPVALDSQFLTWQNYENLYWPAHFLIDKQGDVVYTHAGEGNYEITENNIEYLLGLNEPLVTMTGASASAGLRYFETSETYLGYARMTNFASPESLEENQEADYSLPGKLARHHWALQGSWNVTSDAVVSGQAPATIKLHFSARKVFAVMGSKTGQAIAVKVLLNGHPITTEKGPDVTDSTIYVKNHTLYQLVLLQNAAEGELELTASSPGLELYTFTFGE